jgi:hypothetical protein
MSCLVRDLSDDGARIIFSQSVTIPANVNLHIPQRDKTFRAKVQWRRGDEIGLALTSEETVVCEFAGKRTHSAGGAPRGRNRRAQADHQAAQARTSSRQRRRSRLTPHGALSIRRCRV